PSTPALATRVVLVMIEPCVAVVGSSDEPHPATISATPSAPATPAARTDTSQTVTPTAVGAAQATRPPKKERNYDGL
ncbi:MAG TPA: hypothetical protein VFL67_12665, partial [Mycobacterium sp.]|nr:hypothetical protein [Mycobacterium sp.]